MRRILVAALGLALAAAGPARAGDLEEARGLVGTFASRLKGELAAALQEGGPERAVAVCREKAPKIARELSEKTGWRVGRTALRVRNPRNAPDAWERQGLEALARRLSQGKPAASLEIAEVVDGPDGKRFRYLKAIPTGTPCLTCHGENLAPGLATKIRELYPEDRATGFRAGELRGAFTLSKPLP
ncbi:Tll0287-like domain-containing protein [Deferrisoma sp.]